jgi:UDP-glucose 4-epimerase
MAELKTVLVTGVTGYWGSRVAEHLIEKEGYRLIGLDVEPPATASRELDFIRADVRNPALLDLLESEGIDIVCHLAFQDSTRPHEAAFDANVIGTAGLLGACAEAGVRKVVLKSSMAVYGARPSNPAFLTEDRTLRGSRNYGYTRDMIEIESFCNGFRHRVPEMLLTILRFSSIVGPTVDTPMTRFLKEPSTPGLLGFDPMMQIIHEDDVVEALVHAVINDVPGVFNVAAQDALPLGKIRGLAGKPAFALLHPFAYWGAKLLGDSGLRLNRYVPIELDYIRYPWIGDLSKMSTELGFEPRYTAEETVREFAGWHRTGLYESESTRRTHDEQRLRDIIERRRRIRERQAEAVSAGEEGADNDE